MNLHEILLLENKAWAAEKLEDDPQFFIESAKGQSPDYLWIGCSDSRVPANEITNTDAGKMFVHRNIANMVVKDDANILSVIQYSVEVLGVKHIIVCGHYECGGVKAAMGPINMPIIKEWLKDVTELFVDNKSLLDNAKSTKEKTDMLVELNIRKQVHNVSKISFVKDVWEKGETLKIHGWVYDLDTGLLKTICEISSGDIPNDVPLGMA
ncbi:MAG: carbonic anhydrase [Bacteroidia bacterium]|nr:carbonic anhydrase [Bacteroidia bacterium]